MKAFVQCLLTAASAVVSLLPLAGGGADSAGRDSLT